MNKYLRFYYIDSALMILLTLLILYFNVDQVNVYGIFASGIFYPVQTIFAIISIITLIVNIIFHIRKRTFNEENMLFPKFYLLFYILIVIFGILYNKVALISYIHVAYYYMFLIIGYALMSVYTLLSFKNSKKKNK